MGASICWGATDSGTQLSVFDSSASKKQPLIFIFNDPEGTLATQKAKYEDETFLDE